MSLISKGASEDISKGITESQSTEFSDRLIEECRKVNQLFLEESGYTLPQHTSKNTPSQIIRKKGQLGRRFPL